MDVEFVERNLRQVVEEGGQPAGLRDPGGPSRSAWRGCRSRRRSGTAGTGRPVSVRRCRSSRSAGRRGPACRSKRCRSSSCPGSSPRPRSRSSACASVQELWPSAASGLIDSPGGSSTVTAFACEGDGVWPSVCGTVKPRLSPDGASVSSVVRLALSTGLKVSAFAAGHRRVLRLEAGEPFRVLIGLDRERGDQRLAAARRRVVDQRVVRDARRGLAWLCIRPSPGPDSLPDSQETLSRTAASRAAQTREIPRTSASHCAAARAA